MPEGLTVFYILMGVFLGGGLLLIVIGLVLILRMYGSKSVAVEAWCVEVTSKTEVMGTGTDRIYIHNAKKPVYRYYYNGQEYISSPLLSSNRKKYRPEPGPCVIRIHPDHPRRVYSPERKFAGGILIGVGVIWIGAALFSLGFIRRFLV